MIDHVDDQFVLMELEDDVDFSFAALLVPVLIRVHYAFVDGQANFILIVLIETGRSSNTNCQFLSESDALDHSFQHNFDPLRF